VDDAARECFLRRVHARGEKYLRGQSRAEPRDQGRGAVKAVTDAKFGGRDAEFGIVACESQVASHREGHAAAEADSLDRGENRLGTTDNGGRGRLGCRVVGFRAAFCCAMVVKLGYVSTGRECFVAGPGHDNGANAGIVLETFDDIWDSTPHIEAERVAPQRRVEYEITGGTANFSNEL
jgi:hypothetical protein